MVLRNKADVVSTARILMSTNRPLTSHTILVSSSVPLEFTAELQGYGARVLAWPRPDVGAPDNFAAIDEAIENLFGYDWLIFQNLNAVNFFLRRFQTLGHEISELDALRVGAVGQETVRTLEESQVHIDVIPARFLTQPIVEAIGAYVGGRETLRGLNFLIPCAARSGLQESLEDAGARSDSVVTYRTCSTNDPQRISALLAGGGIDCIAFTDALEVHVLAELFDTNELGRLLDGVAVACIDQDTAQSAAALGLSASLVPHNRGELAQAIAFHFRVMS